MKVRPEDTDNWTKQLLAYEKKLIDFKYKFGVFYATEGQTTEDHFLNNGLIFISSFL
jgi:hypothetical protein